MKNKRPGGVRSSKPSAVPPAILTSCLEVIRKTVARSRLPPAERQDIEQEAVLSLVAGWSADIKSPESYAATIAYRSMHNAGQAERLERIGRADLSRLTEQGARSQDHLVELVRPHLTVGRGELPPAHALPPGVALDTAVTAHAVALLTAAMNLDDAARLRAWTDADTRGLQTRRAECADMKSRSSPRTRSREVAFELWTTLRKVRRLLDDIESGAEVGPHLDFDLRFMHRAVGEMERHGWDLRTVAETSDQPSFTFRVFVASEFNYPGDPLPVDRFPSLVELAAMAWLAGDRVALREGEREYTPAEILKKIGAGIADVLAIEDSAAPGFALLGAWSLGSEAFVEDHWKALAPRPKLRRL